MQFDVEERKFVGNEVFRKGDLLCNTGKIKEGHNIWKISSEGTFKLLEYEQLNEARQSSKEAKHIAIVAMLLTIVSIVAQIIYPVSLDNAQFNKIIEIIITK